jgi:2-keto-4-pentenoate hydratase
VTIDLAAAIDDFWIARMRGEFFPFAYFDRLTMDEAYRIQLALIDRRVAAGERHIGWKVGFTAKAIREQFSYHEPLFACILETRPSGHVFGASELIHPGFETELCVRLGRGLDGKVTAEQVRAAIDVIHPSFEIIETRGDPVNQMRWSLPTTGSNVPSSSAPRCGSRQMSTWLRPAHAYSSTARTWQRAWAPRYSTIR